MFTFKIQTHGYKGKTTRKESANTAETQKQNQDFQNIPAASKKTNPPDIDKEDVQKSSKNKSGKTDNTKNKRAFKALFNNEKRKVPSHMRRNFSF
ncbi:hypothetical protein MUB42_03245 [Apilactobacillus kunkeei]|nr:hypothetical protein MUB42_03245 [Apilactobacillus kunkeei]